MIRFDELCELIRLLERSGLSVIELRGNNNGVKRGIKLTKRTNFDKSQTPKIIEVVQKSKLVGMFLTATSIDSESYVRAGDVIKRGQVIGIIEALGVKNKVKAERAGLVKKLHVWDRQFVEYDQPLITIEIKEKK